MNIDGRKPRVILAMSELFTLLPPEQERRHLDFARIAEAEGIHGLFVSEHVVMGPGAGAFGRPDNPRGFVMPGMQDPETPWPSPLIKLAALGAVTHEIRIMACALIAPLRHPVTLAKELATLDLLTEGRLTVLPTVSWHEEEYDALQVPFRERGRRLDEHLAIWKTLWSESPASYDGEFHQFHDTHFSPRPAPGRIRIWIGGTELRPATLRRIVDHADGLMMGFPLDDAKQQVLAETMAAAGRDAAALDVTGWLVPRFEANDRPADIDLALDKQVPRLVSQGCDVIAIKPSAFIDDPDEMASFCRRVVGRIDEMF